MDLSRERDAEVGRDVYRRLQGLLTRIAARHGLTRDRASDYLLLGALFAAAQAQDMSLDEAVELTLVLADSVQHDTLPDATRH